MGGYRGGSHQTSYKGMGWEITGIMEWSGKFLVYAGVSHDADYLPYQVADKIRKLIAAMVVAMVDAMG